MSEAPLPASRAASLPLIASELALDFTNSVADRGGPQHAEYLHSGSDIILWAHHAQLLSDDDRDGALALVGADEALGSLLLAEAHALRETIYEIGAALARRETPREEDRAALTAFHARCLGKARLSASNDSFAWTWEPRTALIEAVLGPIALSALSMLTQQDLARVKRCEGEHCGWLIFDTTKNRRRRWCEMEVCGNRAKIRAFRARKLEAT
ncbi:CGNR zinc finger domain-containing protein [Bosea sp. BK604]|uniref:CGNR zinc finger domain-containing protein n=1 Tax=Bosea sp. BK604 TaxID=2512180 RepID=UPI0010477A17|nr:CGNR zinc finger domain-containing protein [Bosea sp. BK604]TCR65385.1 putative RNA-binding Zn ribbon-like protein [Bosea sp. BK604]